MALLTLVFPDPVGPTTLFYALFSLDCDDGTREH